MPARLDGQRILMTADAVGGVWTYAIDLAGGLVAKGAAVTLAVLGPAPSPGQRAVAAAVPGLDLLETGLPLDWTAERPAEVIAAGEAVAALAQDISASLVHLNSPALAAGGAFDQPVVGICHSCVATWWAVMRAGPLPADFTWRADLVARGYAAADALIAPSQAFARETARAYAIPQPLVVRNGRARARPSREVEGVANMVFTAGRLWDEAKNLAILERAAPALGLPVLAAGPLAGPNGTAIDLKHVRALGSLGAAEIARHLAARPIFCSPARYEPFGLAILEAADAGCALVLSDMATFRELWDGAALFFSPDDDAGLARAVRSLLADPDLRRRLGEAARMRARLYSVDAMVTGTMAVHERVLGGRRAPNQAIPARDLPQGLAR